MRLTQLRQGQTGVICDAALDAESAAMLRAMGLRPDCRIRLCRTGEPCIVAAGRDGACRIGLTRRLAERVFVTVD
jgi:Fe2+ transport system protein FeoA